MDNRSEVHDFLVSRRARVTPQDAGLISYGQRRVPGLRREEVAQLVGVTTDYYARLERGNLRGASGAVLSALGKALRLDGAEGTYLADLARAANAPASRLARRAPKPVVRAGLQQLLDAMSGVAVLVHDASLNLVATNALGRALGAQMFELPAHGNSARFIFLDPRATDFYLDWDEAADEIVAILRSAAGRDPYDKDLSNLVGELSTRSEAFRVRWGAHEVRKHRQGLKQLRHPLVGVLDLTYESLAPLSAPGLTLNAFSAEPDSRSADRLGLLASWAAPEREATSVSTRPRDV
ncbi:MAG: transcriptional regulator [Cellulomonas sp. 73-145]|uniref:helix-turn-helix domain-containing protein n=1 Tax=Cellulomonas sp. 73-145 TaxID=1895739 RepID=UPI00092981DF|nr:helix-turn-helix domain-containing protein [Cellulomonas sp. 73-145]MBN9328667.1 helix-turn-helix domain-containing protein [Cellulomonas sp.]OJV56731.1 MAG: transcriptional regulator [Cellulomonas sp. 73-145]